MHEHLHESCRQDIEETDGANREIIELEIADATYSLPSFGFHDVALRTWLSVPVLFTPMCYIVSMKRRTQHPEVVLCRSKYVLYFPHREYVTVFYDSHSYSALLLSSTMILGSWHFLDSSDFENKCAIPRYLSSETCVLLRSK